MPKEGPPTGSGAPFQIITDSVEPFVHAQYASLDETELHPGHWLYFASGRSLATMHRLNILHGDWRPDSIAFDLVSGVATPLNLSIAGVCEIEPEVRAADFRVPHATMPDGAFRAFLAGYVDHCWHSIEPHRPGYVGGLLTALDVSVERLDRPRDTLEDIAAVMTNLGLEITVGEKGVSLATPDEPASMSFFDEQPQDCMVLLVGLICAGFDVCALTRQEKLLAAKTEAGRRLGQLIDNLKAYREVAESPAIESHEEAVLLSFFNHLQRVGYPAKLAVLAGSGGLQIAAQILSTMETSIRLKFCRGIVDTADYIAAEAAKLESTQGMDHRFSQGVAQRALLAILMAGQINAIDEIDDLTMLNRHGPAGWRPAAPSVSDLAGKKENELDGPEIIPFLGALSYLQSKGSVLKQRFENSLQGADEHNVRWSSAWDALSIYRPIFPAIFKRVDHWNTRRKYGAQLDAMSKMISGSYAVVLMHYGNQVQALIGQYQKGVSIVLPADVLEKLDLLMGELQAATGFCEFIKDGSLKRKRGRSLLAALAGA